jgi:hypothetical protein
MRNRCSDCGVAFIWTRPALRLVGITFRGYRQFFFPRLKPPGRVADHWPPRNVEVNVWSYTTTLTYAVMMWYVIKHHFPSVSVHRKTRARVLPHQIFALLFQALCSPHRQRRFVERLSIASLHSSASVASSLLLMFPICLFFSGINNNCRSFCFEHIPYYLQFWRHMSQYFASF